jgi:integrase
LINNSPLELTLKNFNIYPKITLKELDYLFPRKIPNSLIKLEQNNFDLFFNDIKTSNPEILSADDEDIDDYLLKPFEILDELKKIKIDGKVEIFFNKKYRLIDKHLKKDDFFSEILMYIKKELFKKADKRFTNNPIKINTMREYMNTLFKYCFNILLKYNEINNFAKIEINQKLEREKLTENSRNKYKEIINRFLSKYSKSILKINSVIDIRRSIVFPDEFNKFINIVLEQDKKVFANENYKFIKGLIRSVFAILLYNSGLRKNELRTRLQKDIIKIGDNEYIIYVDKQGFKEAKRSGKSDSDDSSLKNKNAKRKIRFKIENKEHNEIVAKYYNWITKNNYKFFFPLIAQEKPLEKQTDKEKSLEKHIAQKRLLKRHIAKESFFNELSEILKQITNRHTPLHSLRHSFITFWLLDKLKNKDYEKITMFELANIIGHAEIETTLKNYVHLDIIKVLLNRNI